MRCSFVQPWLFQLKLLRARLLGLFINDCPLCRNRRTASKHASTQRRLLDTPFRSAAAAPLLHICYQFPSLEPTLILNSPSIPTSIRTTAMTSSTATATAITTTTTTSTTTATKLAPKLGRATPRTWSVCRRTRAQVCSLTRSGRVIGKREQAVEKRGTGVTTLYGQDAVRQPVQGTVARGSVSITRSFFDRGAPACTSWQALSSAGSPLLESIEGLAAPAERRDGD